LPPRYRACPLRCSQHAWRRCRPLPHLYPGRRWSSVNCKSVVLTVHRR
jgi:hypothetical protein